MKKQILTLMLSSLCTIYLMAFSENLLQAVSLQQGTHTVEKILEKIERQSTVHFAYDNSLAIMKQDVHLHKSKWTVKEVLDYSFRNTNVAYVNKGKHIVLMKKIKNKPVQTAKLVTVSGQIIDAITQEPLFGAGIQVIGKQKGAGTDFDGKYSFKIEEGTYELDVQSVGYVSQKKTVTLTGDITINFQLKPNVNEIEEVVILTERPDKNVQSVEMGTVKMDIEEIKKIPPFMGEVDVVKSLQTLPGVTTVGEGASGFNVRGGAIDQNLVLLDYAPIYSSSHLFGFFSVFNSDAVKDVQLYKGSIPAKYGGRASSVLDVRQKEGSYEKFGAEGGVGVVSSRLTLQAPIVKDKASILVSGRRSYADLFLKFNEDLKDNVAYFYDLNTQISYKVNDNNRVYLSGYYGRDVFKFGDLFGFNWGNTAASLRWKHTFNDRFFVNTSGVYSDYDYSLGGETFFIWTAQIENYNVKTDFSYYWGKLDEETDEYNHKLTFGTNSILYYFSPGDVDFKGDLEGRIENIRLAKDRAIENAIYLGDEWTFNPKLSFSYGLRYSSFMVLGEKTINLYEDGVTKSKESITGTKTYENNELMQHYGGLEPRLGMKYSLGKTSSIKGGYNRMIQYLQLVSNSTSGLPLDVWKPSDYYTKPLISDQVAVGYFRNFKNNMYEASTEVYYKWQQNVLDYKNGADLFLNTTLEQELLEGQARSYGLEFMLKKNKGKFTGRLSYTLSRSERRVDSDLPEERINNGEYYFANQDKLHDLTFIASYDISKRLSISSNFSYSTGRPFTPAASKYTYEGVTISHYELRNNDRIPDYHRLDFSATLKNKKKKDTQRWESYWNFSVYNFYARKNVFSYNFAEDGVTRLSILGTVIPAVSYNFKF